MSVPATGNITLSGINTVFGKAVGYSLATYNGTTIYDVGTGTSTAIAKPISMRTFANKTPLGRVGKPTISVAENASVAAGTLTNCVTISWSVPSGATPTAYTVEVSTDGTTFTALSTPTTTSTTHTPSSNTRYWYRVRATTTGAVGAWSSNSGVAVLPYSSSSVATFTPPSTQTFVTITGAPGGIGVLDTSSTYRAFGIRFADLQVGSTNIFTFGFGGKGGSGTAGAAPPSFTIGTKTFSGGIGGTGWNSNAGGGGGATVVAVNGTSFMVIGGGGGASDTSREVNGGIAGGYSFSSGVANGSNGGFTGTKGAAAGGGTSYGGAGGQGANANAQSGASFSSNSASVVLGYGGYGVTNGTYAGGGGGGGYSGGGGGAAAANDDQWGGQYFAGGGGGGSSYFYYLGPPFFPAPSGGSPVSYVSSAWAYAKW